MKDVVYKQYSEEESRVYNESVEKIRSGLKNGLSFSEACNAVDVKDAELKRFIIDDVMKITIAEMHFSQGFSIPKVAETLKVPAKMISIAVNEMLDDVGITSAEVYRESNPDAPIGNA